MTDRAEFDPTSAIAATLPGWGIAARNFDAAPPDIREEGYTVAGLCRVDRSGQGCGLTVVAGTGAGLFYGVQTVRQMLIPGKSAVWRCAITDWPDLAFRAMHLSTWVDKVE